jgi:hypothetical protein
LSELLVNCDPAFGRLTIPVFWCTKYPLNVKYVESILEKIADKPSFAKRKEMNKLHITVKVFCNKSENEQCQHKFPTIFKEWKDCIVRIEFEGFSDAHEESLNSLMERFPNALALDNLR